jgi:hypothetical protein
MRLQEHLHGLSTAGLSRLPLHSTSHSAPHTAERELSACKRLIALAVALLFAPLGGEALFAQQAPPLPDANMNVPYGGQFDPGLNPGQQSGYAQQPYSASAPMAYGQAQPLTPDQLEQLVAPIALYPDPLVALVLAASTYPAQVADADHWRRAQGYASSDQIVAGANVQNWDPSLKALTAFPVVLAEMDQNLQWTTALGNAYYNQPQNMLQAVQLMRQRARAAGNLESTPQQVVSYSQGDIQLAPANPQVVYVPVYNPWTVYGQPVSPYPGFSLFGALGSFFNSSVVRFGLGMVMTAFNHSPWGLLGWGLDWLAQNLLFHQSNYYSSSTSVIDRGFSHGGPRAFSSRTWMVRGQGSPYRTPAGYDQRGREYGTMQRQEKSQGFLHSSDGYARTWSGQDFSRSYRAPVFGNTRPPLSTYNRGWGSVGASQAYSRPGYGSGFYNTTRPYNSRPTQTYAASAQARNSASMSRSQLDSRPGYGSSFYNGSRTYNSSYNGSGLYNSSASAYAQRPAKDYSRSFDSHRAPSAAFSRSDYGQRSSEAFMGSNAKAPRSGGFHLFGSRHSSESFHGGGHEPKGFGGEKHFGGHSGGGGHHSGGHGGHHH